MGKQFSGEDGCCLGCCDPRAPSQVNILALRYTQVPHALSWLPGFLSLSSASCLYGSAEMMVITKKDVLSGLRGSSSQPAYPASSWYPGLRLCEESRETLGLPLVTTAGSHRGFLRRMHLLTPGGAEKVKAGFEPPVTWVGSGGKREAPATLQRELGHICSSVFC